MSITAPTLSISPEKVCFFIEKAHEFDIADSGANVADEGMIDPTFQELTAFHQCAYRGRGGRSGGVDRAASLRRSSQSLRSPRATYDKWPTLPLDR